MRHLIVRLAALTILLAAPAVTPAFAEAPPEVSVAEDGLAARGYDVAAYFLQGGPVIGSAAHQLQYKGATWRFASAENLARFKADPSAYAPQFGGYCAWAVSQGYIAPGDPKQWKIVDGRLYLNANARAKELWEADQAEAIVRGHANWPGVLTNNQDSER
ncbi:MAG TPA: YHS domain-containing (seleno)protein [Sphingomicrobium sp.]|nr:YHS domain-containing (seleno)protein [Sphingomicrobium sp.]